MIKKLTFIIFISCCLNVTAQNLTFKIDSIKVYHLPLSMRTFLALNDYDVRHWDQKVMNEEILKIHVIKDSLDIYSFTEITFMDTSNITTYQYSIDARIVIDIFMEKGILLSIVMDDKGYYILGNEKTQRSRNKKLIDWLKKYITDFKR
jgi:hypothetical protein